jgi:acyl carrier protein
MSEQEFFILMDENFGINKSPDVMESKLSELGLDSLDFAQFKYLIEGKANLKFTAEEEKKLPNLTVNQLLVRLADCNS